jgi:hypothetical protein
MSIITKWRGMTFAVTRQLDPRPGVPTFSPSELAVVAGSVAAERKALMQQMCIIKRTFPDARLQLVHGDRVSADEALEYFGIDEEDLYEQQDLFASGSD